VAPLRRGDADICVGSPEFTAVLQAMDQLLFAPPFVALNFATLKVLEVRVLGYMLLLGGIAAWTP
jgi:hypothetical protein